MRLTFAAPAVLAAVILQTAAPALAVDCEVSPYQAYLVAQPRGWQFNCLGLVDMVNHFAQASILHEPPNGLGCHWRTAWRASSTARSGTLAFFGRNDLPSGTGALRNGWRISAWELSGGSFVTNASESYRISARFSMAQHNRTYRVRVSRLVLSRDGGSCANAIQEAF